MTDDQYNTVLCKLIGKDPECVYLLDNDWLLSSTRTNGFFLVKYFMEHEMPEVWEEFYKMVWQRWAYELPIKQPGFIPWLLKDPARFIDLIWDWTGIKEVQERWGWVACDKEVRAGNTCYNRGCDDWGECKGKLPAPWLIERKEK